MSILGWILLGLIAGFLASKIVNKTGSGIVADIALGIVGAVVGGFVFQKLGHSSVEKFDIYSLFVATVGAIIVLTLYHMIVGRRAL